MSPTGTHHHFPYPRTPGAAWYPNGIFDAEDLLRDSAWCLTPLIVPHSSFKRSAPHPEGMTELSAVVALATPGLRPASIPTPERVAHNLIDDHKRFWLMMRW
jgi:hypothetical protein